MLSPPVILTLAAAAAVSTAALARASPVRVAPPASKEAEGQAGKGDSQFGSPNPRSRVEKVEAQTRKLNMNPVPIRSANHGGHAVTADADDGERKTMVVFTKSKRVC